MGQSLKLRVTRHGRALPVVQRLFRSDRQPLAKRGSWDWIMIIIQEDVNRHPPDRQPAGVIATSGPSAISMRMRGRISGVRRSCDMAAIMRMRSSLKRRSRSRIRLKALMIPSISRGPCGGTDGSSPLGPRRSSAPESSESGFTTRLAATSDKRAAKARARTTQAATLARENSAATGSLGGGGSRLDTTRSHCPFEREASIQTPFSTHPPAGEAARDYAHSKRARLPVTSPDRREPI
jgi:hypothetical protein